MAHASMDQEGGVAVVPPATRWLRSAADRAARTWYDKVPSKFADWSADEFARAGFRAVPDAIVRRSAFIGRNAVLMPSFVNVGAYVGEGTMIDTWATVGSCAQIGRNCHISGGTGIGGVLEPLQANPVIIEDNCFIGARSEVAEGVIVGEGAVLGMGVFIGASTKIVDRATGQIHQGRVPPYSVVVAGVASARRRPTVAVLRRDREDGGRADALEDVDQRAAARLSVGVGDEAEVRGARKLAECCNTTIY